MRVTFRCKRSGNTVSFDREADIDSMRKNIGYEEVKDGLQTQKVEAPAPEVKRRGRPKAIKQE